jgi:hypothetical protein
MKIFGCWMYAVRLAVLALLFLFSCSDPVEDEVTPKQQQEEQITKDQADALLETFSFTAATPKITGTVPTVTNTSLIKTNSEDTIFVLPGIKSLIRLSHPKSRPIKGLYFSAKGSSFYYDVDIHEEEESDTVSVILFEINPEEIEPPYDVPVQITAYDDNSQPIDIIERTITIEKPHDDGCGILQPGDTARIDVLQGGWFWEWTVLLNPDGQPAFINAPTRPYFSTQNYSGCCDSAACPALVIDPNTHQAEWIYDSEFTVTTYYSILIEYFNFFTNGTFHRFTVEGQSGIDSEETDWCKGVPADKYYRDDVYYYGTHDYAPGNNRISYATTHSDCADPLGLCGYGSRGGQLTLSCHAMIITAGSELQKEIRMYRKTQHDLRVEHKDFEFHFIRWMD